MADFLIPIEKLLKEVVGSGLCAACGTCVAVCPEQCISMQNMEPAYSEGCTECGACYDSCPGKYLPMTELEKATFGRARTEKEHGVGVHIKQFAGHASDPEVRSRGTAGGVVTALLCYLLESGIITGAVCTGFTPGKPWIPAPIICRTVEEIRKATKSKYALTSQAAILQEAKRNDKLALVGLPCQVAGLRKAEVAGWSPDTVKILIGILCAHNFRLEATIFVIEKVLGLSVKDVKEVGYRLGDHPGSFLVKTTDGKEVRLPEALRRVHIHTMSMFRPYRCITCCDWAAELADISVGDVYTFDPARVHVSNVLARNQFAMDVIQGAMTKGYVTLEEITSIPMVDNLGYRYKYHGNRIFIREARRHGLPTPTYPENP